MAHVEPHCALPFPDANGSGESSRRKSSATKSNSPPSTDAEGPEIDGLPRGPAQSTRPKASNDPWPIYPYPSRVVRTALGGYTHTPRGSFERPQGGIPIPLGGRSNDPPGGIPIPFCAGFLHFRAKTIEDFAHREAFRAHRLRNCTKGVQMKSSGFSGRFGARTARQAPCRPCFPGRRLAAASRRKRWPTEAAEDRGTWCDRAPHSTSPVRGSFHPRQSARGRGPPSLGQVHRLHGARAPRDERLNNGASTIRGDRIGIGLLPLGQGERHVKRELFHLFRRERPHVFAEERSRFRIDGTREVVPGFVDVTVTVYRKSRKERPGNPADASYAYEDIGLRFQGRSSRGDTQSRAAARRMHCGPRSSRDPFQICGRWAQFRNAPRSEERKSSRRHRRSSRGAPARTLGESNRRSPKAPGALEDTCCAPPRGWLLGSLGQVVAPARGRAATGVGTRTPQRRGE